MLGLRGKVVNSQLNINYRFGFISATGDISDYFVYCWNKYATQNID